MQQENQLKVVNKKGCHAELVSASSTHVVSQRQQQRRAWKTPNHYYRTPYYNLTGRGQAVRAAVWGDNSLFNNSNNGFTLIELLVVVLIIGILAAVAVPQYQKAVMKSRYATLKNLVRSLSDAEERYYLANSEYTTDIDLLDIDFSQTPTSVQNVNTYVKSYFFSWGQCDLAMPTTEPRLACQNESIGLKYAIQLSHVASNAGDLQKKWAGKHRCALISTTHRKVALARQICQQETGDVSPYAGVDYFY